MKLAFWRRSKPAWADVSPEPETEIAAPAAAYVPAAAAPPVAPAAPAPDLKALLTRLDRLEATAASVPALTVADLEPLKEQIALLAARIDALPAAAPASAPVDLGSIPADGIARIRATLRG